MASDEARGGGLLVGQDVAINGFGEWVAGVVKSYDASTGKYIVQVKRTSRNVNASSQVSKYMEHLHCLSGGVPYIYVSPSSLAPASPSTADRAHEAEQTAEYEKLRQAAAQRENGTMTITDKDTGAAMTFNMPGGRVTLKDLVARPDLNGQSGTVQSFSAERSRFGVLLDGTSGNEELLAIKMANLNFLDVTKESKPLGGRDSCETPSAIPPARISTADAERLVQHEGLDAIVSNELVGEERAAALHFMYTEKMVFDALDAGHADKLAHALDNGHEGGRGAFPINHREHGGLEQTLLLRSISFLRGKSAHDETLKGVLRVLLTRGADPNLTDAKGGSGLVFASLAECDAEVATILLDAGADPTYRVRKASIGGLPEPNALELAVQLGNTPFVDVVRARMPTAGTGSQSPRTQSGGKKKKHQRRRPTTPQQIAAAPASCAEVTLGSGRHIWEY